MLTNKDYCDYEACVALKELGYDELCEGYYHLTDDEDYNLHSFEWCDGHDFQNSLNKWRVGAPMLYEAQKWLREDKGIIVGIINNFTAQAFDYYVSTWEEDICRGNKYVPYEEAISEGIKKAVKILRDERID